MKKFSYHPCIRCLFLCYFLLFIFQFALQVVYDNVSFVHMDLPYISGYLGFKEAKWYKEELDCMWQKCPEFYPQVAYYHKIKGIFLKYI